jgi:hypothetical protein
MLEIASVHHSASIWIPHLEPVNREPIGVDYASGAACVLRVTPPKPAVDRIVLPIIAGARVRHVGHQIVVVLVTAAVSQ